MRQDQAKYGFLIFFNCLALLPVCLSGQCLTQERTLIVKLLTDNFPGEIRWEFKNNSQEIILQSQNLNLPNHLYQDTVCVPGDACLSFQIFDTGGDGICCSQGEGFYKIFIDGALVKEGGDFGEKDFGFFNCQPGMSCMDPVSIEEGTFQTLPDVPNTWYLFEPDSTGVYEISTCDLGNSCPTVIWGYNRCDPFLIAEDNTGTAFYNRNYCGEQAAVTVYLEKLTTYFLRIGNPDTQCSQTWWKLDFKSGIDGCTDPFACNYDPLATTDDGSCIYQGNPDCAKGPDLEIDGALLKASLYRDVIQANSFNTCLIEEGCLKGYGQRTVIRFDTKIANIGEVDYFVGQEPSDSSVASDIWEWDACHNHWHYEGYAEYLMFDSIGQKIPIGFKNGFCVLDWACEPGIDATYSCFNQGISAGCYDIYESYLACQWIDITELPAGKYTFVTRINWNLAPDFNGRYETSYANNWAQVCLEIFRDEVSGYVGFFILDDCDDFLDCKGEVFGNAKPDCRGVCNGEATEGDVTQDGVRNQIDIITYMEEILTDTLSSEKCLDLNDDGVIGIADPVLLLDCLLHQGNPVRPGHSHTPCEFPFNITNPFDTVFFALDNLQPDAGFFDLFYKSPAKNIAAFQLKTLGVRTKRVESLLPFNDFSMRSSESQILGYSLQEKLLPKTLDWVPLARVYFDQITGDSICIQKTSTCINQFLETVGTVESVCSISRPSNASNLDPSVVENLVLPNPCKDQCWLKLPHNAIFGERARIYNLHGREIYLSEPILPSSGIIEIPTLPQGIYFYRIPVSKGLISGKFLVL